MLTADYQDCGRLYLPVVAIRMLRCRCVQIVTISADGTEIQCWPKCVDALGLNRNSPIGLARPWDFQLYDLDSSPVESGP